MKVQISNAFKDITGKILNVEQEVLVVNEKNEFILDANGSPIKRIIKNLEEALTLGKIIVQALLVHNQTDKLSGEEKVKRYQLAMLFTNAKDEVEISLEDVVLLKKLIGEYYSPLIVGQAFEMIEK